MNRVVRMTRRVAFSSGHRYWMSNKSPEENKALFGKWASPYNHGHNFILDVTVEGSIDPLTGMVVNIKRIDDVLRERIVAKFDQRSINDEVEDFQNRAPSLENLMLWIWEDLSQPHALPSESSIVAIRLEEMPGFYGELENRTMTLTRTYEFAASHRLHSPLLDDQTNLDLFGKCNNPAGHGHNYILEVTVEGPVDPKTGMMADLGKLDEVVEEAVVDRYDHKYLNEDLPEFQNQATTSEIVTQEIYDRLADKLPAKLVRVRLWETARNMFEVTA